MIITNKIKLYNILIMHSVLSTVLLVIIAMVIYDCKSKENFTSETTQITSEEASTLSKLGDYVVWMIGIGLSCCCIMSCISMWFIFKGLNEASESDDE